MEFLPDLIKGCFEVLAQLRVGEPDDARSPPRRTTDRGERRVRDPRGSIRRLRRRGVLERRRSRRCTGRQGVAGESEPRVRDSRRPHQRSASAGAGSRRMARARWICTGSCRCMHWSYHSPVTESAPGWSCGATPPAARHRGGAANSCEPACKPDSVPADEPAVAIYLGPPLPAGSCGLPGTIGRATRSLFGLAPGGVWRAAAVTRSAGGLLHHRFTLACAARAAIGGLLSVPLSVGSPRLGVTQHRALWSPDFPRHPKAPRPPGGLTRATVAALWECSQGAAGAQASARCSSRLATQPAGRCQWRPPATIRLM